MEGLHIAPHERAPQTLEQIEKETDTLIDKLDALFDTDGLLGPHDIAEGRTLTARLIALREQRTQ